MSTLSRTVPEEKNINRTLERLGGEDIIRRKYPELYKAVLNSRERAKTVPPRTAAIFSEQRIPAKYAH